MGYGEWLENDISRHEMELRMDRGRKRQINIFSVSTFEEWSPKIVDLLNGHGLFKAYFRRFNLNKMDAAAYTLSKCTLLKRRDAREEFRSHQEPKHSP